jgi:hypothetical protein
MASFFGGDTSKAHYTTDVPATHRERALRREQQAKLQAAGYKQQYFQYAIGDKRAQEHAARRARLFAEQWSAKVGIELVVQEGMFL